MVPSEFAIVEQLVGRHRAVKSRLRGLIDRYNLLKPEIFLTQSLGFLMIIYSTHVVASKVKCVCQFQLPLQQNESRIYP